jgi:hypothetical protein
MKIRKSSGQGPLQNEKSFEVLADEDQLEVIGGTGDELIVWPHAIDLE